MIDYDALPHPATKRIAVHITPAAERALRNHHPWVFDGAIRKQNRDGAPGDLAVVFDGKRRFLAIGLYDPDSPIRVKVLQHTHATINREWFAEKIRAAAHIRAPLTETDTNGFRLVHGENDGLPGLVVDRYADTLVMKLYSAAWLAHLRDVIPALAQVDPHKRLVLRLSRNIAAITAEYGLHDGMTVYGEPPSGPVIFRENGLRFAADVVDGHKTGFFCDQRDNRARVRDLSAGRRVLDVFAYNGGFSVYAAAGGAQAVTSLDISGPALESARANMQRNHERPEVAAANHTLITADAFDGLAQLHTDGTRFDMVIVDPPSFAKSAAEINRALHAYERLAGLALDVLEPSGLLVMASCSSRVTAEAFFDAITRHAHATGRQLHEIARTGHALDHPVGFPEGAYLKCLLAEAP